MRRVPLSALFWLVAALAAVSIGVAAGPLAWRLAGDSGLPRPEAPPEAGPESAPASIEPILALAPFGRLFSPEEPAPEAKETDLGLTLHGVIIADPPAASSAIVSGASLPARSYAVGASITDAATLAEVGADHVILSVEGRRELLSFPEERKTGAPRADVAALRALVNAPAANPAPEADANTPEAVIARYRARIQDNPQTVLDSLGVVATAQGYRVGDSASTGVRRAGLQPGDVVTTVNGQQVGNIEADRRFFDEVAASGRARIEVLRDGQRIVMSFPLR